MNRAIRAALLVVIAGMTFGCARDALQLLKQHTDIDLAGQSAKLSLIDREDLDQVAYGIALDDSSEHGFLDAIEKVSDKMCREQVASGQGCHYLSKARHDVFITKTGLHAYTILTSG